MIHENDFPACRTEGDSVMFVDDDSDVVSDPDPVQLLDKLQHEANLSCDWLKDNKMVVAGDKSKMLIVGTKEMRRNKLGETVHSIVFFYCTLIRGKTKYINTSKIIEICITKIKHYKGFFMA